MYENVLMHGRLKMDNVFFQTVMGFFEKKNGDISYPQLDNVHLGKTELLSEYYSRVFSGNDYHHSVRQ